MNVCVCVHGLRHWRVLPFSSPHFEYHFHFHFRFRLNVVVTHIFDYRTSGHCAECVDAIDSLAAGRSSTHGISKMRVLKAPFISY